MKKPYYVHKERVRYSDTDALGIVNNIAFFYFMEAARFEFWRSLGFTVNSLAKRGLTFAVARQSCEYEAPVYYDDLLYIGVGVKEVGRTSFALFYEMKVRRKNVARGEIVFVCIKQDTRQPVPLPLFLRKRLKA